MAREDKPTDRGVIITDKEADVCADAAHTVDENASKVAATIITAGE